MSETGEMAAWLRKQAEADIDAASKATPGPWKDWGGYVTDEGPRVQVTDFGTQDDPDSPDRPQGCADSAHIARHDPPTEAARAESVLAVLDDYAATLAVKEGVEAKLKAGGDPGPNAGYLEALRELAVYESVVRRLTCGYRRREGFRESWA